MDEYQQWMNAKVYRENWQKEMDKNDRLKRQIDELKKALMFYANVMNWDYSQIKDNMSTIVDSDIDIPDGCCEGRGGKTARKCLSEIKAD